MICRRIALMTDLEVGYVSAAIDGEGCLQLNKCWNEGQQKYYYLPHITVCNNDRGMLDYIHQVTGVGSVDQQTSRKNPIWRWKLHNTKDIRDLLIRLLPYSKIKVEQMEILIKVATKSLANKENSTLGWRVPLSSEEQDWREQLYLRLKSLHHRGVTNSGEFGESLYGQGEEIIPSRASKEEGVEVSPEIKDISAAPEMGRDDPSCLAIDRTS